MTPNKQKCPKCNGFLTHNTIHMHEDVFLKCDSCGALTDENGDLVEV